MSQRNYFWYCGHAKPAGVPTEYGRPQVTVMNMSTSVTRTVMFIDYERIGGPLSIYLGVPIVQTRASIATFDLDTVSIQSFIKPL